MLSNKNGKAVWIMLIAGLLGIFCAGCSSLPPIPTPTVAPTRERTALPTETEVAILPSPTDSETPTDTVTPTGIVTLTRTPRPSETPKPTDTSTGTLPPTVTDTPSDTATVTPLPTLTDTETPLPTDLPTLTPTDTPTVPIVVTLPPPTSGGAPTETAHAPITTASATVTPLPIYTATKIQVASTATSAKPIIVPNAASTAGSGVNPVTATPTPLYRYDGSGKIYLPPSTGIIDVSVNPKNNAVAIVFQDGHLEINGARPPIPDKLYGKVITMARWSPDGRYLAVLVRSPNAETLPFVKRVDDGLWILDIGGGGGATHALAPDVYEKNSNIYSVSVGILWSPNSDTILVPILHGSTVGQAVLLTAKGGNSDPKPMLDFYGATWIDGDNFVATPDTGISAIEVVNRNTQAGTVIANGANLGLWIQNPVLLADGRYAFLGSPSSSGRLENRLLSLYILAGGVATKVSDTLPAEVLSAEWNSSRTALLVRLSDTSVKEIYPNGTIIDDTLQSRGLPVHWR